MAVVDFGWLNIKLKSEESKAGPRFAGLKGLRGGVWVTGISRKGAKDRQGSKGLCCFANFAPLRENLPEPDVITC